MDKIDGVKLEELVKQATAEMLLDRKNDACKSIKKLLYKYEGVCAEITKKDKELTKLRDKKENVLGKVKQIQDGNWSILDMSKDDEDKDK